MTGLEYIQKQINLVKQQIKGSKIKFIITDTDPVTKVKKLQYDLYENELQTLESIEKSLKALEIIKKKRVDMWHLTDLLEQTYKMYLAFCKSEKYEEDYILAEEEFNLLKEVLE